MKNELILVLALVLSSCSSDKGINNCALRDRVIACGAGFSEDTQASLVSSIDKTTVKADAAVDFKDEVKIVIFNKIPPSDRLKAYEDYIRCIEAK
ncbi:MAG: hypothetical protein WCG04_03380 [Alphaproteobacteria bacterium]